MVGEKTLGISAAATLKSGENYIKILTTINKTKMQFQTADCRVQLNTDSGDLRLASLENVQGCLCCFCRHTRPSCRLMIALHTTSFSLLVAMNAGCGDVGPKACHGWIRHSRRQVKDLM